MKMSGSDEAEGRTGSRAEETQGSQLQSQVYTATEDTLFPNKTTRNQTNPLSLRWVTGMNPALPVFSLQDHNALVVLYITENAGIIYNHTTNSQHILQGHSNRISCLCVSDNRRWVATADQGPKGLVMIWDSYSGIPVHTLFDCHTDGGVIAMAFSADAKYLATLGAENVQRLYIWDWMNEREQLLCFTEIKNKYNFQERISFNPNDSAQLLSSSLSHVVFYCKVRGKLRHIALELKKHLHSITNRGNEAALPESFNTAAPSVFHQTFPQILTGTSSGCLLVWNVMVDLVIKNQIPQENIRLIPLQKDAITAVATTDGCIVTCDVLGDIMFYDEEFQRLTWYNKLNLDAIVSISFSKEGSEGNINECTMEVKPSIIRNFVVSTVSAQVLHMTRQANVSQIILNEDCDPLHAVACHPKQPVVAMGNHMGVLKMWDYEKRAIVGRRVFKKERQIACLTFDPEGSYLAVGFGSGAVHVLNPNSLQSDPKERFRNTEDGIIIMTFSSDSKYLATADCGKAVTVFRLLPEGNSSSRWTYLGSYYSHYKPIVDLLFGVHLDSTQPRLLSLGMDRHLVEYDLAKSEVDKLLISNSVRIEQSAVPMCMSWYPPLTSEQFLLVVSDQFKIKLLNSTTRMCRKTLLGPTHDSPLKKTLVLPNSEERDSNSYYLAYITDDELGLQILPVDGNPFKSSSLICHPNGVSSFACSNDARYIFTTGGSDCTVLSWEISLQALEVSAALGGEDLLPFYTLIEGGRGGGLYKEIEDFFYYCQVRHEVSDLMEQHQVSKKIPLSEVPSLMRALAFFPTEQEIEDMQNEVKFSKYAQTGKYVTDIDLGDFLKLYINHRPAFGLSTDELTEGFHVLGSSDGVEPSVLRSREMLELLQARGEHMTEEDVVACFTSLLGLDEEEDEEIGGRGAGEKEAGIPVSDGEDSAQSLEGVIPDEITVETFTHHILGFLSSSEQSDGASSSQ